MKLSVRNKIQFQKGVTMIEYAVIAALLSIAAASMLPGVGSAVNSLFDLVKEATQSSH